MTAILLFILLLVTSFGVLIYFLKPTKTETAVEEHLATIEGSRGLGVNPDGTTILKQAPLSSNPMLDELLRRLPGVIGLASLIKQAGQTWQVGSVVLTSLIAFVLGSWIASFFMPTDVLSVLLGLILAVSPLVYLYILREVRFKKCDSLLPEAVDLMARGLRAGHAVPAVLEMVGREIAEPLAGEFRALINMRVPPHHFVGDSLANLSEGEMSLFAGNFGMQHDLQQEVAQLLPQLLR